MKLMIRQKRIKERTLNQTLFPCGVRYFEENKIMFIGDGSCGGCVLVHNNWIVSRQAKIYRFQETGLWQVDTDGYYSDSNRKYLSFDNPLDFGPELTLQYETNALKTALLIGHLLNRTVILPTFHCYGCKYAACNNTKKHCALNTYYKMTDFEEQLSGLYREHVFLQHKKVPVSVKTNRSEPILIDSALVPRRLFNFAGGSTTPRVFTPLNFSTGATLDEIVGWFQPFDEYSVLRFRSMYGAISDFLSIGDYGVAGPFARDPDLMAAFKPTDYRQYHTIKKKAWFPRQTSIGMLPDRKKFRFQSNKIQRCYQLPVNHVTWLRMHAGIDWCSNIATSSEWKVVNNYNG